MQRLLSHPRLGDALLFAFFAAIFTVIAHG
jgi:hypothetical protein